jgi:hypothetical protein
VALPTVRRFAVLLSGAILLLAAGVLVAQGRGATQDPAPALARALDGAARPHLRAVRLATVAAAYRGGPIVTSTGETVDVRVSDALPAEVTPESWAEFLAHLTHGSELSQLTTYILTFPEVQETCGPQAAGCYARNLLVAPGEAGFDTTPEEVVRHEYGHHVAYHRLNPPWAAIDWGPKRWASAVGICSRVARSQAYPGNEGLNYARNPGEAWAETYRILQERNAGITTGSWRIVDSSFVPDSAALQAAAQDVVQPWTGPTTRSFTRVFGKKSARVWWIRLATPLDGSYRLSASVPTRGSVDVALISGNRSAVVKRTQWVGQRSKRAEGTICGERSLFVRVTERGVIGRIRVSVTIP